MELYNTCERMIARGKITGMQMKLDIFYVSDRLTEDEYKKLTELLAAKQEEV